MSEQPSRAELWEKMRTFTNLGGEFRESWSFPLQPIEIRLLGVQVLIGNFPQVRRGSQSVLALLSGDGLDGQLPRNPEADFYYRQVLGLALPKKLLDLDGTDNRELRRVFELRAALNRTPNVVVSFCEGSIPEEDAIILAGIMGISPRTALSSIQDRIKDRFAKRN